MTACMELEIHMTANDTKGSMHKKYREKVEESRQGVGTTLMGFDKHADKT